MGLFSRMVQSSASIPGGRGAFGAVNLTRQDSPEVMGLGLARVLSCCRS